MRSAIVIPLSAGTVTMARLSVPCSRSIGPRRTLAPIGPMLNVC